MKIQRYKNSFHTGVDMCQDCGKDMQLYYQTQIELGFSTNKITLCQECTQELQNTLNKETSTQLKALEKSIHHWQNNYSAVAGISTASVPELYSRGFSIKVEDCECCCEFRSDCTLCPIGQLSKEESCRGTPYSTVSEYLREHNCIERNELLPLVQAELSYLQKLHSNLSNQLLTGEKHV